MKSIKKNLELCMPYTSTDLRVLQELPCLSIANPEAFKIVERDASDIGYGGIIKQKLDNTSKEILVRYTSGTCNNTQKN